MAPTLICMERSKLRFESFPQSYEMGKNDRKTLKLSLRLLYSVLSLCVIWITISFVDAAEGETNLWSTGNSTDMLSIIASEPEKTNEFEHVSRLEMNYTSRERRNLKGEYKIMNKIDACWRYDPNWALHRNALADCALGFGSAAIGGKNGKIYTVTDPGDDPVNPKFGTLRFGAIQPQPLWIIFKCDMVIKLKSELIMNSYKTIDGRGADVHIAYGTCITVQYVSHIIIHGINIHDCLPSKPGMVRSSPSHLGHRDAADGDGISIFGSNNIWIDHCTLSRCADGLIDAIHASTAITISNNYFYNHDKVMLLGHNDNFKADKILKATIVFNHFGRYLEQRMPRGRFGYFHVANNDYTDWELYAIGGSANPTFLSEGNRFTASNVPNRKEVTKRENRDGIKSWNWRSSNDLFLNGAYFVPSGNGMCAPYYSARERFIVAKGALVPYLTADAGVLNCIVGKKCE